MSEALKIIVTAVCFLATAVAGTSTILCVGADGHVDFEVVGARCCDEEASPQEVPGTGEGGDERGPSGPPCGGCTDVTLEAACGTVDDASRSLELDRGSGCASQARATGQPPAAPPGGTASRRDPGPSGPRGAARQIRTIILRR